MCHSVSWPALRFDTVTSLITWLSGQVLHWFLEYPFILRTYFTSCKAVSELNRDIIGKVILECLRRTHNADAWVLRNSAWAAENTSDDVIRHVTRRGREHYGAPWHNIMECDDVISHVTWHSSVFTARVTAQHCGMRLLRESRGTHILGVDGAGYGIPRRFTPEHCGMRWRHLSRYCGLQLPVCSRTTEAGLYGCI